MTAPLRIIFAGTPAFAAQSLQAILDQKSTLNCEVVAAYTQPDRKAGRGQKLTASEVKQLALANHIPVEQPVTFKKSVPEGMVAREVLASYQADVMVVAAYGLILPLGVLNTPRLGCINIHASLLPRWRGAAPIHRAILAGDEHTGITIMQMDKGLDTGDMLYKTICPISHEDTSATLHDKLATLGGESIVQVLANISHYQQQAEKQDENNATYAEKLTKAEGKINWQLPALAIHRHIRGLQPWPVAYTDCVAQRVRVHGAMCAEMTTDTPSNNTNNTKTSTSANAGTVLAVDKTGVTVQCGHGQITLTSLQWAGGKALTAEQLFASQKLNVGDVFE